MAKDRLTPAKIMQLGTGFWSSKTLLSAIELGLFTELAKGALDGAAGSPWIQAVEHPRHFRADRGGVGGADAVGYIVVIAAHVCACPLCARSKWR